MRVVLDTNVFVSSFYGGKPREVINLWKKGKIEICISEEILEEYLRVLNRAGAGKETLEELLDLLKTGENLQFARIDKQYRVVEKDPHDNKFIECAIAAGAKYIISGDRHLLEVKEFMGVKVVTPSEFLKM